MNALISTAMITTTLALATPAFAQETARLRGEVTSTSGDTVTVTTQGGDSYDVTLTDDFSVLVYEYIEIGDVRQGDFLSIPSTEGEDGRKVAVSINVFPEALRGTGEGETAWDLTEDSLMTNATVGEVVNASDGSVIVVSYNGEDEPVLVPEGTPITEFNIAPDRDLSEGDMAILFVTQEPDGGISANLAGVAEDGSLPPV
ncbi:hypothetical protein SAMN04488011_102402 [Palleronia pelagia]|uniref:DUF5666 domain-containing protein n=2 Tax=Palleronia pelagia TaxID=387096 RepID=A0A1H8DPW3_9RHOB|nr:hypothetical protein SAMN04488011_102402 [Palleronia pelagia]